MPHIEIMKFFQNHWSLLDIRTIGTGKTGSPLSAASCCPGWAVGSFSRPLARSIPLSATEYYGYIGPRLRYLQQNITVIKRNLLSSRPRYLQRNILIVGTRESFSPPAENKSNLIPRFSVVISILISKPFSIWFYFFPSYLACFIITKTTASIVTGVIIAHICWILCHISNFILIPIFTFYSNLSRWFRNSSHLYTY